MVAVGVGAEDVVGSTNPPGQPRTKDQFKNIRERKQPLMTTMNKSFLPPCT